MWACVCASLCLSVSLSLCLSVSLPLSPCAYATADLLQICWRYAINKVHARLPRTRPFLRRRCTGGNVRHWQPLNLLCRQNDSNLIAQPDAKRSSCARRECACVLCCVCVVLCACLSCRLSVPLTHTLTHSLSLSLSPPVCACIAETAARTTNLSGCDVRNTRQLLLQDLQVSL